MLDQQISLPSKPKIILNTDVKGTFEIEGLYPGYGHTLGNSLRRIILSSLHGASITSLKINDAKHEFSTISGVKEDVLMIILNLKKVRFKMLTDEPQKIEIHVKGEKNVTAADIKLPGQLEIYNKDQHIATLTKKDAVLDIEAIVQKGMGYMPKEALFDEKMDVGAIAVDAIFTPVRRVNYEVENMRVGKRTDYNRLRITIETDGTVTPKEALEYAIEVMIHQLKAIIGFKDPAEEEVDEEPAVRPTSKIPPPKEDELQDTLKIRVDDVNLSPRTMKALSNASIRTIGGLVRKTEEDLLAIEGLGAKGITEIKRVLSNYGLTLKS